MNFQEIKGVMIRAANGFAKLVLVERATEARLWG
jgi:hypothetical protein